MMLHHIVRNGGNIILIVQLLIAFVNSYRSENALHIQQLCSQRNVFAVEPGDTLVLSVSSGGTQVDKWYHKTKPRCSVHFRTSDSAAHFQVTIYNMSIPSCQDCKCNYFEISSLGQRQKYCGEEEAELYFSSKTNSLVVLFQPAFQLDFHVSFAFDVSRNSYVIRGSPHSEQSHYIETPFFPNAFPSRYKAEYVLKSDDGGRVMIQFLDFHLAERSFVEVRGGLNGSSRYYGSVFRPPVIVSQSDTLFVQFESHSPSEEEIGFRAVCTFIKPVDYLIKPVTECGGSLSDTKARLFGLRPLRGLGLYDCVWLVMPVWGPSNLFISVRTLLLKSLAPKSRIEIREGIYSSAPLLKDVRCQGEECSGEDVGGLEASASTSSGLYIRFVGYLDAHSALDFAYSYFHTGGCTHQEFSCTGGGRCLHLNLRCDGIEQCPDGNDESECPNCTSGELACPGGTCILKNLLCDGIEHCIDGSDERNCPTTEAPSLGFEDVTATKNVEAGRAPSVIIFIGCFGFFAVFVALAFIYKKYSTISHLQARGRTAGIEEMTDFPSTYPISNIEDGPPSYEDFVKTSDLYPPLLYTRGGSCLKPCYPANLPKTRYHSDISIDLRAHTCSLSTKSYSSTSTVKSIRRPRRSQSLDSKLDSLWKRDTCHLFISLISARSQVRINSHSLPKNYKFDLDKVKDPLQSSSSERRFTWSIMPNNREVVAVMKTRCHSDPCHSISIHCSLDN